MLDCRGVSRAQREQVNGLLGRPETERRKQKPENRTQTQPSPQVRRETCWEDQLERERGKDGRTAGRQEGRREGGKEGRREGGSVGRMSMWADGRPRALQEVEILRTG